MDLEKINEEYAVLKKDLENVRNEVESLEKKLEYLDKVDKKQAEVNLNKAKLNGDKTAEKDALDVLKSIEEEYKNVKKEAEMKKANLIIINTKIQSRIKMIKTNPEMKKHLDTVLSKKYERKINSLQNEKEELEGKKEELEGKKEELEGKKERITNLQRLVTEHETLGNNLKGMMTATKQIKDLEKELEGLKTEVDGNVTYSDPERANEIENVLIPEAQDKLKTNKEPLISYITKKGLDITEQDINEIVNKDFVVDGKGKIDLNKTFNNNLKGIDIDIKDLNIAGINRQIKGLDKSIKHHQMSLQGLDIVSSRRTNNRETYDVYPEPQKPKWYQFIKRFKNWNEKRKQEALPESDERDEVSYEESENSKDQFKNSLKYEIVRDIVEKEQEDSLKKSKQELKRRNRNSERQD